MRAQGFTLVEQLAVVAILAIVFATGSAALQELGRRVEARSTVLKVDRMLSQARHAALGRQMPVAVCGSHDGLGCNGRWGDGLLVFLDPRQLGQPQRPGDILGHERLDARGELRWRGFGGSTVRFDRLGRSTASNGSFTYCADNRRPEFARQVVLNRGGRIRHSRDRDGDGIHEDSGGRPLSC